MAEAKTNAEKVAAVIARIDAGESERSACASEDIVRGTFRSAALKLGAADQYAKALTGLAYDQIEKLEQAIDDMRSGVIDHKMARVEIDARKWFASKFLPKQFGDKTTLEHTDPSGNNPFASLMEAVSANGRPRPETGS